MNLVTGAIGSLLPKLVELLKEEYKLQKGVQEDIKFLSREMSSMHAALSAVAEVPRGQLEERVKLWADDVRELSYQMEDIVDTFLVRLDDPIKPTANPVSFKALLNKMANLFNGGKDDGQPLANPINDIKDKIIRGKDRHKIAGKIQEIKDQVKVVAARRDRYRAEGVVANSSSTTTFDPRILSLYKHKKDIVGIEEATNEIIRRLECEGDGLKTLSIFGFGGLGKTTLAKSVYDRLSVQFTCGAFVMVGRTHDKEKVLREMLFELDKKMYKDYNGPILHLKMLITLLQGLLKDKRYFIVLDDIWDTQTLEIIRCALIDTNCGSRIITTTRNFEVALKASDVFKQQPLSHDKSKKLFYTRLFGGQGNYPSDQLAEITTKVLQKCGGVPLAIIAIASVLASKPRGDWSKVYNSIGFGYEVNEDVENMRKILLFSYYDLPSYLRTCLLHLSTFPQGYLIRKKLLIWKWAAEGFLHEEQETGLYELGERYFNELINKSMIQPVLKPNLGIVIGCHVHDMVLDMISSLSKEENFVVVLDGKKQNQSAAHSNARRLAIQKRAIRSPLLANICMEQIRSFNATMCHIMVMPPLSSFLVLRVLAIENCTCILYNLEDIVGLVHLRYLGLYGTPVRTLPEEIGNLRFLQTLDLRDTMIKRLPRSIVRLRQLKYLRANYRSIRVPDGLGNLTSLEELRLSDVSNSTSFMKELGKLVELRNFKIWIKGLDGSSNKELLESLGSLKKIQVLQLRCKWSDSEETSWEDFVPSPELRQLSLWIKLSRPPTWINSSLLPNLSHLFVYVKELREQAVQILGMFPELLTLTLLMPHHTFPCPIGGGAFLKLRYFCTSATPMFLEGAMSSLESVMFNIHELALKSASFDSNFGSLEYLPLLKKVGFEIRCSQSDAGVVDVAEISLRDRLNSYPNRPILGLRIINECEDHEFLNDDTGTIEGEGGSDSSQLLPRTRKSMTEVLRRAHDPYVGRGQGSDSGETDEELQLLDHQMHIGSRGYDSSGRHQTDEEFDSDFEEDPDVSRAETFMEEFHKKVCHSDYATIRERTDNSEAGPSNPV